MIKIFKVKQNLAMNIVQDSKEITVMISPGETYYSEIILPCHIRLRELGLIFIREVEESEEPLAVNSFIAPVEEPSVHQVTSVTEEPELPQGVSNIQVSIKKSKK